MMPGIDNDQQNRIKHFQLTQVSSLQVLRSNTKKIRFAFSTYEQTNLKLPKP